MTHIYRTSYKILIVLLAAFLASCNPDHLNPSSKEPDETQGADLSVKLYLDDFSIGGPGVQTRAIANDHLTEEQRKHIYNNDIESICLCVVKLEDDPNSPIDDYSSRADTRIVAYRLFVNEEDMGHDQKYFFKNIGGWVYRNVDAEHSDVVTPGPGVPTPGTLIPDTPVSDAGGIYGLDQGANRWLDDQTDANSEYGFNGFTIDHDGRKAVEANFIFSHPMHGDAEKLRSGEYALLAIANFNECPSFCEGRTIGFYIKEAINYWQRHQNDEGFDGLPYMPVDDPLDGDPNHYFGGGRNLIYARVLLNDAHIDDYVNDTAIPGTNPPRYMPTHEDVISSDSFIHNSVTTLIATRGMNMVIANGSNHHDFSLRRSVSRVTFAVSNHGTREIRIRDFSLSNNISSAAVYLYPGIIHGGEDRSSSPTWLGAPVVTSSRAIVPFDPERRYASATNQNVFFDALLGGSRGDNENPDLRNPYTFSATVEVMGEGSSTSYTVDATPIRTLTQLGSDSWATGESYPFLIGYNGYYLYVDNSGDLASSNPSTESISEAFDNDDFSYYWEFVKQAGTNQVYIKSKKNGKYINFGSTGAGNAWLLGDTAEQGLFTVGEHKHGANTDITLLQNGTVNRYLKINNATISIVASNRANQAHMNLFAITQNINDDIEVTKTITDVPIRMFDVTTGIAHPLYELRRNRHLTVLLNVNYSADDEFQDITFEVRDWRGVNNTIQFD